MNHSNPSLLYANSVTLSLVDFEDNYFGVSKRDIGLRRFPDDTVVMLVTLICKGTNGKYDYLGDSAEVRIDTTIYDDFKTVVIDKVAITFYAEGCLPSSAFEVGNLPIFKSIVGIIYPEYKISYYDE